MLALGGKQRRSQDLGLGGAKKYKYVFNSREARKFFGVCPPQNRFCPPQMEYFYALELLLHPEINTVLENCFVPAPDNFTSTNYPTFLV